MDIGKCTDVFSFFWFGVGEVEGGTWEDLSMEEFIMGKENFNGGGAWLSSIIEENNEKINMKSFFNWK